MNDVKLKIKYFGPIAEGFTQNDSFMTIPKVTIFCGPQGSGKSTVSKVLSSLIWLEKAAHYIGWTGSNVQFNDDQIIHSLLDWHGLKSYFQTRTEIHYIGTYLSVSYANGRVTISSLDTAASYEKPKVMYVPAERNFLAFLKSPTESSLPRSMLVLSKEFDKARNRVKSSAYDIPVNGYKYTYDSASEEFFIENEHGGDGVSRTPVAEASSGLQSILPLLLVTDSLASDLTRPGPPSETMTESLSLSSNPLIESGVGAPGVYFKGTHQPLRVENVLNSTMTRARSFVNIVEEPEQNLFPPTQKRVLRRLLEINNQADEHRLVISTHSPYLIEDILASIRAKTIGDRVANNVVETRIVERLNKCYPVSSRVAGNQVALYETSYDGTITKSVEDSGLISDRNFLNRHLMLGSMLLDELTNLEDALDRGTDAGSRAD